ncbi:hypothetical protein Droror1_Dr00010670 [Drosera rotundifolia]
MGGCASKKIILFQDHSSKKPTRSLSASSLANNVVKVVDINGELQEFDGPISAREVTSSNPNCFVCSAETMLIDSFVPCLSDRDVLEPGHLYFLMPEGRSKTPLSLEDLCALAIKASSYICIDDLKVSFRHGK